MTRLATVFAAAGLLSFAGAVAASETDDQISTPSPSDGSTVVIFLLDNSASLPALDPQMQRVEAAEKMFEFMQGEPYRLILFGGGDEIYLDEPNRYKNNGQWTDFYFAVARAKQVMAEYPEDTGFKMVLITDGVLDPSPADWSEAHEQGRDVKSASMHKTVAALKELEEPLYVILIGDNVDRSTVDAMVSAANGDLATNEYAQELVEFFEDDGLLLRRFIFRLEPEDGIEVVAPMLRRITTIARPKMELYIASPLLIVIALLIGAGVRSFPGAGDREMMDLRVDQPLYIAVDRFRRLPREVASWSWKGLSLVESSRDAHAMLTAKSGSTELPATGIDLDTMDELGRRLVVLSLEELRDSLEDLAKGDDKEGQIYALNLQYVAQDLDGHVAERILLTPMSDRTKIRGMEFLRAKVHLLREAALSDVVCGPRIVLRTFGLNSTEKTLRVGSRVELERYTLRVNELRPGGPKDFRITLGYESAPSALWLKKIVPGFFQRLIRFRRAHERVVA